MRRRLHLRALDDDLLLLLGREHRGLAGRAHDQHRRGAVVLLELEQRAERREVDRAVLVERRDHRDERTQTSWSRFRSPLQIWRDHTTGPTVRGGFGCLAFAPGLPISAAPMLAGRVINRAAFGRWHLAGLFPDRTWPTVRRGTPTMSSGALIAIAGRRADGLRSRPARPEATRLQKGDPGPPGAPLGVRTGRVELT